jgi:hypothetical protein
MCVVHPASSVGYCTNSSACSFIPQIFNCIPRRTISGTERLKVVYDCGIAGTLWPMMSAVITGKNYLLTKLESYKKPNEAVHTHTHTVHTLVGGHYSTRWPLRKNIRFFESMRKSIGQWNANLYSTNIVQLQDYSTWRIGNVVPRKNNRYALYKAEKPTDTHTNVIVWFAEVLYGCCNNWTCISKYFISTSTAYFTHVVNDTCKQTEH